MALKFLTVGPFGKVIPLEDLGNGNFSLYGIEFCIKFYETHPIIFNQEIINISIFTINSLTGGQYGTLYKINGFDIYFASHYDKVYMDFDPITTTAKLIAEL